MSVGFQWTKTSTIWFFVIGLAYSVSIKKEITCYVCTPPLITDNTEASEIYITFSNYDIEKIPTCGSNAAINFTLKCPEGYKGCLTKIHGKTIMKSCNEYPINDCKIANNIKYCFCADTLCNDATILTTIPISTDDEDLDQSTEDGSGLFDDWSQLDKDKYIKTKNNTAVILNNTFTQNYSVTNGSATKLLLPKNINILSLILVMIFKVI